MNSIDYSSLLTKEQTEAVMRTKGSIVVCAGAGSGKTRVIAYRVAHLIIVEGYAPRSIVCVTFTNKAAREMRERIGTLLCDSFATPSVTTFHSYGLSLIRSYGATLGIEKFSVLDEDEKSAMIAPIVKKVGHLDKTVTEKKIIHAISSFKNSNEKSAESFFLSHAFHQAYLLYEQEKRQSQCFDFDDILLYALALLKNKSVKEALQKTVRHILVDEYQDTNVVQHEMIKKMAQGDKGELAIDSLCVVGDEDQSIYSWRGAQVCNITNFAKDFPHTHFIAMTQNYRSTKEILSLANKVIVHNHARTPKKLWTEKASAEETVFFENENGFQEARTVVYLIKSIKERYPRVSCAVLYRAHYQSRLFEEECVMHSIPYRIWGSIGFYERQEIKDILAYATIAINGNNRMAFLRSCNTPSKGLGNVFQSNFMAQWQQEDDIIVAIDSYVQSYEGPGKERIKKIIASYGDIIKKIRTLPLSEAFHYIIDATGYLVHIEKNAENPEEIRTRKENVFELLEAAKVFEEKQNGSLRNFIDHVSLMHNDQEEEYNEEEKQSPKELRETPVFFMTLHAAKGLEFSYVFLVGLEEGLIPSTRSFEDKKLLEEECRLLYVGITRAQERVFCSYACARTVWGSTHLQEPSRFIAPYLRDGIFISTKKTPYYLLEKRIKEIIT